jgi:hypothetical protein
MQFTADPRQLGQAGVQQQFNVHKCEAGQNPVSNKVPDNLQNTAPAKKAVAKVSGK